MRSDHLYASLCESLIEQVRVIGMVSAQPLGFLAGATHRKCRLFERDLVRRSARRMYAQRKTRSV
jgi:hypothetical protein